MDLLEATERAVKLGIDESEFKDMWISAQNKEQQNDNREQQNDSQQQQKDGKEEQNDSQGRENDNNEHRNNKQEQQNDRNEHRNIKQEQPCDSQEQQNDRIEHRSNEQERQNDSQNSSSEHRNNKQEQQNDSQEQQNNSNEHWNNKQEQQSDSQHGQNDSKQQQNDNQEQQNDSHEKQSDLQEEELNIMCEPCFLRGTAKRFEKTAPNSLAETRPQRPAAPASNESYRSGNVFTDKDIRSFFPDSNSELMQALSQLDDSLTPVSRDDWPCSSSTQSPGENTGAKDINKTAGHQDEHTYSRPSHDGEDADEDTQVKIVFYDAEDGLTNGDVEEGQRDDEEEDDDEIYIQPLTEEEEYMHCKDQTPVKTVFAERYSHKELEAYDVEEEDEITYISPDDDWYGKNTNDILTSQQKSELVDIIKNLSAEQSALKQKLNEHDKRLNLLIKKEPSIHRRLTTRAKKIMSRSRYSPLPDPNSDSQSKTLREEDRIYAQIEQLYTNFCRINFPLVHRSSTNKCLNLDEADGPIYSDPLGPSDCFLVQENAKLRKKVESLQRRVGSTYINGMSIDIAMEMESLKYQRTNGSAATADDHYANTESGTRRFSPSHCVAGEVREIETTFEWEIPDYSVKKHLERSGKRINTISRPFDIGHEGYRGRLEIYLNGNGSGVDRCMSVFLRIIKGPSDGRLQWPAVFSLSFILVNQDDSQQDCSIVSSSSEKLFYFTRPFGDSPAQSDSWGLIEFVPHSAILKKHYIKNDTIKMQVKIGKQT